MSVSVLLCLSVFPFVSVSVCLSLSVSHCLCLCLSVCLSLSLSVSVCLPVSVCLSACLRLSVCLSLSNRLRPGKSRQRSQLTLHFALLKTTSTSEKSLPGKDYCKKWEAEVKQNLAALQNSAARMGMGIFFPAVNWEARVPYRSCRILADGKPCSCPLTESNTVKGSLLLKESKSHLKYIYTNALHLVLPDNSYTSIGFSNNWF